MLPSLLTELLAISSIALIGYMNIYSNQQLGLMLPASLFINWTSVEEALLPLCWLSSTSTMTG